MKTRNYATPVLHQQIIQKLRDHMLPQSISDSTKTNRNPIN